MSLAFYTPEFAKGIRLENRLGDAFVLAARLIANRPAWTMEEFDRAKAQIQRDYPSIEDLWTALAVPPAQRMIEN